MERRGTAIFSIQITIPVLVPVLKNVSYYGSGSDSGSQLIQNIGSGSVKKTVFSGSGSGSGSDP
jgi:hypothetical protein